ncbi:MAG: glycosyltransferase [Nitriliruptoraceae bacterium]
MAETRSPDGLPGAAGGAVLGGWTVTVIVVNYNTRDYLPQCLAALNDQTVSAMDIIVVDNASDDGSAAWLRQYARRELRHRVRVITNSVNRGYATAINDALAMTMADVVVFANADVQPASDAIERAAGALRGDERRGSVQPLLLQADRLASSALLSRSTDADTVPQRSSAQVDEWRVDSAGHTIDRAWLADNRGHGDRAGHYTRGCQVLGVTGAFAVHRRAMLDDVRWPTGSHRAEVLSDALFAYFEDVELDWRARCRGWTAWFEPSAIVLHERGGRGSRRAARVERLNWANRLLVAVTCDSMAGLGSRMPLLVCTAVVKLAAIAVRSPQTAQNAVGDVIRGLPAALRRRRLLARQVSSRQRASVSRRWMQPWRPIGWARRWSQRRVS